MIDHTTPLAISCMMTVAQHLWINCRLDKEEQPALHIQCGDGIGVEPLDPKSYYPEEGWRDWEDTMPKCSLGVRVLFGTACLALADSGYQWFKSSVNGTWGWLHCGMDFERTGYPTIHECLRSAVLHWSYHHDPASS